LNPSAAPQRRESPVARLLKPLASLRLTVVLLLLSLLVIFAGTWAQRFHGIWDVQQQYFHSWVAWTPIAIFLPTPAPGAKPFSGGFPIPGGYSLIVLLLVNLLAAHSVRFKLSWKRSGVILIHLGLIMLLLGEVVTSLLAVESQMNLDEGATQGWTHDIRETELAVIDPSPADHDDVTVLPQAAIENGGATVADARLPFEVHVDRYMHNARPLGPMQPGAEGNMLATAGAGVKIAMAEQPRVSGVETDEGEVAAAFVTFKKDGQSLGTYLLSLPVWVDPMLAKLNDPQPVTVGDKTYLVQLRFKRIYKRYQIHLIDFSHDRHVGTDTPRNFASSIVLTDPSRNVRREAVIRMNQPLRYAGDTIFQSGFRPGDKTTILLVVSNPGWLVPYVACVVGAVGMLIHFGIMLFAFLRRQKEQGNLAFVRAEPAPVVARPPPGRKKGKRNGNGNGGEDAGRSYTLEPRRRWTRPDVLVPLLIGGFCAFYALSHAMPRPYKPVAGIDVQSFARTPVNFDGRTMPLDSLARNALKIVSGRESIELADGRRVPASEWLLDVLSGNERSREYQVFRIDHLQLKSLMGFKETQKLFSWNEIFSGSGNDNRLQAELDEARKTDPKSQDPYQRKVVELYRHLTMYLRLASAPEMAELYSLISNPSEAQQLEQQVNSLVGSGLKPGQLTADQREALEKYQRMMRQAERLSQFIATADGKKDDLYFAHLDRPDADGHQWVGLGRSLLEYRQSQQMPPAARTWMDLLNALRENRGGDFNRVLAGYNAQLQATAPTDARKADFELYFNRADPFTVAIVFYIGVFLFACLSWLLFGRGFGRTAWALLALAFVVHTFGLIARMYISGRPPVTNLYSSAIFIAWGGVLLCAALEWVFRNRIGLASAALIGFMPLLVANGIAFSDAVSRGQADTMGQLQAVLDTNFWLATHVVVITLGYATTFLAGLLACVYVVGAVLSGAMNAELRKTMYRMVYGTLCFAILFSFVGTILGGIWADQSWGRFWGWDPKENGAAMIVLWNAVVLHARWGGLARERGVMLLAIFGNVMTAWSWFGTNMLGIGLHAYGFMESAPFYLGMFIFSQLALIALGGLLPQRMWRSNAVAAGFEPVRA
jgi:ABC-type transport system involved in cytochrome c biogenesis permease subunit